MSREADAPVLQTRGLVKRYGDLIAVDRMNLTVPAGDVYGLLGPNGAGKTTFMRMLFGLIRPDDGSISVFGRPGVPGKVDALRDVAGFVETARFCGYTSGSAAQELLGPLGAFAQVADRSGRGLTSTDRRALENALVRQREFTQNSHELRMPLTVLTAEIELALGHDLDAATREAITRGRSC